MSPRSLPAIITVMVLLLPVTARCQDDDPAPPKSDAPRAEVETKKIKGWGDASDPAGNCEINANKDGDELEIKLGPGTQQTYKKVKPKP